MDIRDLITPEEKKILRRIRKPQDLPDSVKAAVYGGNLNGVPAATQFNKDLVLYGLWEALLYVQSYEAKEYSYYKPGTAENAVRAWRRDPVNEDPEKIEHSAFENG